MQPASAYRGPAPRVLYVDVDGTLTRDGNLLLGGSGPSLASARALVRLAEAGVEVVLASGREVAGLAGLARAIGCRTFIAELGSVVAYEGGARLLASPKPPAYATARMIRESGASALLMGEFPGLEYHAPWDSLHEHTVLLRGLVDVGRAREMLAKEFPGLTLIDNGPIGGHVHAPSARGPGHEAGNARRTHAYHLLPEAIDKAAGVAADRRERLLPREACAAVGDSVGDLAFAREVGACFILGAEAGRGGPDPWPANAYAHIERFGEGFEAIVDLLLRPR